MTGWNIGLWLVQAVLAVIFLLAGWMKVVASYESLNILLKWTQDFPELALRVIGGLEVLAAIGLILPAAFRIVPSLTAYAAGALALDMLLATIYHLMRGEMENTVPTVILLAIAALICWGRLVKAPIVARNAASASAHE